MGFIQVREPPAATAWWRNRQWDKHLSSSRASRRTPNAYGVMRRLRLQHPRCSHHHSTQRTPSFASGWSGQNVGAEHHRPTRSRRHTGDIYLQSPTCRPLIHSPHSRGFPQKRRRSARATIAGEYASPLSAGVWSQGGCGAAAATSAAMLGHFSEPASNTTHVRRLTHCVLKNRSCLPE